LDSDAVKVCDDPPVGNDSEDFESVSGPVTEATNVVECVPSLTVIVEFPGPTGVIVPVPEGPAMVEVTVQTDVFEDVQVKLPEKQHSATLNVPPEE
jgi:hypothetical protein